MIYNIIKENNVIGKGTFGKIYYNKNSYPNYVVKKMKKYNNHGSDFILNNIKELWWYSLISKYDLNINNNSIDIDNISNINFTNIPKLLDYNINSDYIHLLIDYKGSSIHSLLKENGKYNLDNDKYENIIKLIPLIIYSCSKVFMQLHYANIRHGDITISNIMYNEKESDDLKKISIIDWGSIVFSKLTLNNYNQCALEFMAPELYNFLNENEINDTPSIKSDIFSLGIVLLYILDPSKQFLKHIEKYIKDSTMLDNQYETLDDIITDIIKKYKHVIIDKRIIYLIKKMLDININNRIDIDSLYMDELFTKYRNLEQQFDKYFLRNILKKKEIVVFDSFKNLLIEKTYNYLKSFKSRIINNVRNSKCYKLLDTRVILMPSLQLFYSYLNKINKNEVNVSCLDNSTCNNHACFKNNTLQNINHYIVSFLCCIKWIDIIFNDDITLFHLYGYYSQLYNLFLKSFPQSVLLDLLNFGIYFDLTFYNIFKKMDGIILSYPYFMNFKYDYLNHSDIKKILLNSEKY